MAENSAERDGGGKMRIGRYQVESVVGTGAFATVYRAVDERLDDQVAIKVLAENHSLNAELRERFITEGRVLRRIDNPHVLQVYDLGETVQSQPYLVLEYAERGSMTNRVATLRNHGWIPTLDDLWSVAEPLARALQAVHRVKVVHRDVNPSNVLLVALTDDTGRTPSALVREHERLVLADLGMCKDLALNSGHTSAGGTEGFRPPELRHGPAIIDPRADLWSLSAVLVWLATGATPGNDVSPTALARSGVPQQLSGPLSRSLAANPADRHPDAATWLRDIEHAIGRWAPPATKSPTRHAPDTADAPHPVTGLPERPAPPSSLSALNAHTERTGLPRTKAVWHSLWMLALLPLGFTTWAGFLYIGLRAQRARWLWYAAIYGVALAAVIVVIFLVPTDASGALDADSPWSDVAAALIVVLWLVGLVHGALTNRTWLRLRATL